MSLPTFDSLEKHTGDTPLVAAVKPAVDMSGEYTAAKELTVGDNEALIVAQGIGWVQRKMFNSISPTMIFKQNEDSLEMSGKMGPISFPSQELRWDTLEEVEVKEGPPFMKDIRRSITWDEEGHCFHERYTYTCSGNGLKVVEHRRMRFAEKDGEKYLTTRLTFIPQDSDQEEISVIRVMRPKKA